MTWEQIEKDQNPHNPLRSEEAWQDFLRRICMED